MNLEQLMGQEELRAPVKMLKPKTRSAIQVAKRVFELAANGGFPYKYLSPETWAKRWLKSEEFKLMEIDIAAAAALNINAAASPHMPKNPNRVNHYLHCSVESLDPIVVDLNKRGVGKSFLGYIPPVVVLDGKHRKMAQLRQGRTRILAWVGCRAIKRMPVETLHEVNEKPKVINGKEVYLPPVEGTKIAAAYEIHASTVPSVGIGIPRQDSGEGGSRPKDSMHSGKKKGMKGLGGTGANGMGGPGASNQGGANVLKAHSNSPVTKLRDKMTMKINQNTGEIKSPRLKAGDIGDCNACGARSSGTLVDDTSNDDHKIPPDESDASTFVEPSDQLKWNGKKAQTFVPGTGPGYVNQFGSPNFQAPGSGVGQRVLNKGASNSDFSRTVDAKGKRIPKIFNKLKSKKGKR